MLKEGAMLETSVGYPVDELFVVRIRATQLLYTLNFSLIVIKPRQLVRVDNEFYVGFLYYACTRLNIHLVLMEGFPRSSGSLLGHYMGLTS